MRARSQNVRKLLASPRIPDGPSRTNGIEIGRRAATRSPSAEGARSAIPPGRAAGKIVEKEVFFQTVWPGSLVEESNLTQSVFVLRKTLAEGKGSQTYIETIPKRGYRFAAEVWDASAAKPADVPERGAAAALEEIPPAKWLEHHRHFLWAGCAGALVAGAMAASRLRFSLPPLEIREVPRDPRR